MKTISAETRTLEYPCLVTRTIAAFIDLLVTGLAMLLIWEVCNLYSTPTRLICALLIPVISYEPIATVWGATLGQYLMRIRIRKANDQKKSIGILHSYLRFFLKLSLNLISLVPLQTKEDRRAMHDKASGSIVLNI